MEGVPHRLDSIQYHIIIHIPQQVSSKTYVTKTMRISKSTGNEGKYGSLPSLRDEGSDDSVVLGDIAGVVPLRVLRRVHRERPGFGEQSQKAATPSYLNQTMGHRGGRIQLLMWDSSKNHHKNEANSHLNRFTATGEALQNVHCESVRGKRMSPPFLPGRSFLRSRLTMQAGLIQTDKKDRVRVLTNGGLRGKKVFDIIPHKFRNYIKNPWNVEITLNIQKHILKK